MKQEDEFEKQLLYYDSWGGEFMESLSCFLNIFSGDPHVGPLIIGLC